MRYQPELDLTPDEVLDYLRKSRTDDPMLSVEEVLARHETILDEWAEQHLGGKVPEENKYREVVSGEKIKDRPEFCELLRRIESPKIKAIKCADVQRLSRGDLEDAGRLINLLRHTNTLVIVPERGHHRTYDLRDEYDRDAFERELKRGNEFLEYQKKIMNRGRLLSVQQGNFIGQKPPYGYDKTTIMEGKKKCHTLKINPEQADVVRMIFDMYVNQDFGMVTIARRLNELGIKPVNGGLWAQDTIKRMLDNEHYIGKVRWNWRKTIMVVEDGEISAKRPQSKVGEYLLYEGKHEGIIPDELFKAASEKRGRNYKAKPDTKIRNPLAGLVFCRCGRAMSYRTYMNKGVQRNAPRLLCDNQAYCKTSSCLYDEMLERVCEVLEQCIQDFEIRIKEENQDSHKLHANLIKRLEAKRKELDAKELAQWEAQADPDPAKRMPEHIFKALNEKLLKEKEEVREALCKAYESMPEPIDYEERLTRFHNALEALKDPNIPIARQNTLLKACIERIDYTREKSVRSKKAPGEKKGERFKKVGGHWESKPFEIDVKLRL